MREKIYTIVFMVVTSAVFTAGVSAVNLISQERIELNRELARRRVMLKVLGLDLPEGADLRVVTEVFQQRVRETELSYRGDGEAVPIMRGVAEDGTTPIGYVFEVSGRGFWDVISGYMAVSPDLDEVLGLAFYKQSETPGLGAEITQPWFEEQFRGKALPPDPEPGAMVIRFVQQEADRGPHTVDAITGATQTSLAVERLLNADLRSFLEAASEGP